MEIETNGRTDRRNKTKKNKARLEMIEEEDLPIEISE
jgi:hypothetical protein